MPKYAIMFKAQLEGIEKLTFGTDFRFNLDCEHPSSGEEYKNLWVTQEEEMEIPGSRGTCHVMVKVGDKRHGTIKIEKFDKEFVYTGDQSGKFVKVCEIECRDLEPKKWVIETSASEFTAYGAEEKTTFDEIEFEDGAWFDYDDEAGCEVSIQELGFQFKRC
eukprot:TRINITY_DN33797_c0_g1_i1.p2 TRINITY_DN33797_c0_g1~~TRINITY_DN33797_c0_g1_i1.p2  ORF type:complete len:182 (+),score=51.74 TRINITY_DN33797_c0_g1_i1:62-547(+)